MPEGDSLYRYAASLREALAGKTIDAAHASGPGRRPRTERITGAAVTAVEPSGKNVLIHFDNGLCLRIHLRMFGTFHIYEPGERWRLPRDRMRLVLEAEGVVVVNFDAPVVELLESRAVVHHRPIAGLGPDLLDDAFDPDEAFCLLRDPALANLTIGDAIMEQRAMAGVGNIWKHETLFRCRINPWRTVASVADGELRAIIATAHELLRASVGKDGRRAVRRYIYGRGGQPCLRCRTRIRKARQGRDIRYTAWCPKCQPGEPGQRVPTGRG